MNILIFEDEIYNFRLLRHLLLDINPDYDVIGPVTTVEEGRMFLANHRDIGLIIADIQLNDGLSFDALSYASEDIPIIFTTAYDEYALKAFEYNSLSYLLKPIDEEELRRALRRAFRGVERKEEREKSKETSLERKEERRDRKGGRVESKEKSRTILGDIALDAVHRHCFLVRTARGERRVHVSMVRYVVSENKTTYIHLLDGSTYPIDFTLNELASQLDGARFMRVSRKYIVPLEQVKGIEHLHNGRMQLVLYGSDYPEIVVSRDMRKRVMEWISR